MDKQGGLIAFGGTCVLRVSISQAKPGMRLALPVRHPERGTILLADGFALEQMLIEKLHELNVHELWIEYPDTEQIKQFVSPVVLQQQANLIGTVADLFDHVHQ